jgi:hypothetical protein
MRRRRAMRMVTALIMGAAIRPRPVFVKIKPTFGGDDVIPGDRQITPMTGMLTGAR